MNVQNRKNLSYKNFEVAWKVGARGHFRFEYDGLLACVFPPGNFSTWDIKVDNKREYSSPNPISLAEAQKWVWAKYFLPYQTKQIDDIPFVFTPQPPAEIRAIPQLPRSVLQGLNSPIVTPQPLVTLVAEAPVGTKELITKIENNEILVKAVEHKVDQLTDKVNKLLENKQSVTQATVVATKRKDSKALPKTVEELEANYIVLLSRNNKKFIAALQGVRLGSGGCPPKYQDKWCSNGAAEAFWKLAQNAEHNKRLLVDGWKASIEVFDKSKHGKLRNSIPRKVTKKV